jgi:hypothetical protein
MNHMQPGSAPAAKRASTDGFGRRVFAAMCVAGISSATRLGKACGVSRQTAVNWLAMREPHLSGEHLFKLSVCLHVRIAWLVTGDGTIQEPPDIEQVLDIMWQLTPDKRTKWLAAGKRLAGIGA